MPIHRLCDAIVYPTQVAEQKTISRSAKGLLAEIISGQEFDSNDPDYKELLNSNILFEYPEHEINPLVWKKDAEWTE